MFRRGLLAGSLLSLGAALTLAFAAPIAAQDDTRPDRPHSAEAVEEHAGLLVDLHHYLNQENGRIDEHDDADVAGRYTGGPVALLTKEEGMIRSTGKLHVIVYASREDAEKLRERAGRMVGQRVRVIGVKSSRDGVTGIAAKNLTEIRPADRQPQ